LNRTATELAKAEEARELRRASAKGWELMSALDGQCLYFMSGWWSYSFCYGKTVVQFHAVASRPGEAPTPEENSLEYVLGKTQEPSDTTANHDQDGEPKSLPPPNGQLQVKGDQRYLSQRLEDGTLCDLTGRPRTIEIQYHCSPGTTADRIGWVKEVTTCTYLMVVYTPRLCSDVAFHPPKETRAHPIRCRQILSSEEEENTWRYNKMVAAGELLGQKPKSAKAAPPTLGKDVPPNYFVGTNVGGIIIGAKKHVTDQYADKLPLARGVSRHGAAKVAAAGKGTGTVPGTVVEVLASKKKDATETEALSDEELEQMNLDPKRVGEFREEMERLAGNRGWKLQVMDVPGEGLEYLGAFDDDEGEVQDVAGGGEQGKQGKQGKQEKQALKKEGKGAKGEEKVGGKKGKVGGKDKGAEKKDQEGSEEMFFKEEL
jgi:protein OS-9